MDVLEEEEEEEPVPLTSASLHFEVGRWQWYTMAASALC